MSGTPNLARRLAAEAVGTAFLLSAVVGSGIMGESLSGGNVAMALLANTMATGAALVALIAAFEPVSGAHFNPAVTLFHALRGALRWSDATAYMAVQFVAAAGGVVAAHVMFAKDVLMVSQQVRAGFPLAFSEAVATFGLLCTIWGCSRHRGPVVPFAVGAYIAAAYWFTASTSFANPAVTVARAFTNTYAGIRPVDVPPFVIAQLVGAALATLLFRWLTRPRADHLGAVRDESVA